MRFFLNRAAAFAFLIATGLQVATVAPARAQACTGDCGLDGEVTVDEILRGVNIALGTQLLADCPPFDESGDGQVTVDEILQAVNNALNGCPVDPGLPPDPATVAPPVDPAVATTLAGATEFLYIGEDPIQTGVTAETIEPRRAAVLRGRVLQRTGTPLGGVRVAILNHPEYGQTLSRADGMYDLVVNGGGELVVEYKKEDFLTAQRQVSVPWQDYVQVQDVALIPLDSRVTNVVMGAAVMQVARGNPTTDANGTRQATLLFPAANTAEMVLPDGTTQPLDALDVRATEYTVGDNGPAAMPANLPPTSGYTYAVELSADEALSADATEVRFSKPLPVYVENFLGFPVGMAVPTGYYDRAKSQWIASANGRVIQVLGFSGDLADLDVDGDGAADTGSALADLGVTDAERARLAELYAAGESLWRLPISHFTPWDANWPFAPPADAKAPDQPPQNQDDPIEDGMCEAAGSIIECQNQVLGERVGITGTPFSLNYRSNRVPGRAANRTLDIPLSGASVPASLKRIELTVDVAGQRHRQTFSNEPEQSTTFTWDGLDAYERAVQGQQTATVRIGYVYEGVYLEPADFRDSFGRFGEATIEGVRSRQEITLSRTFRTTLGSWDARGQGLGGWTLDAHHAYDPLARVLHLGNGQRRSEPGGVETIIESIAGGGSSRDDNVPADEANLGIGFGGSLATAPDGSIFLSSEFEHRIRKIDPDNIITTFAGQRGQKGFSGDGGPAVDAEFDTPRTMAVAPDGSLYVLDHGNARVRRIDPGGTITTVAGGGSERSQIEGLRATDIELVFPNSGANVAVAPDGTLYVTSANVRGRNLLAIDADGIVRTLPAFFGQVQIQPDGLPYVVGRDGCIYRPAAESKTDTFCFTGEPEPRDNAALVLADGSLLLADHLDACIKQFDPIDSIATFDPEDSDDTQNFFRIEVPGTVVVGRDLDSDSLCSGGTDDPSRGDGGPAVNGWTGGLIEMAQLPDGSVLILDVDYFRIRRLRPPFPAFTDVDILIASESGAEVYAFDKAGRHLLTLNSPTGAVLREFTYDAEGRLAQVEDAFGNTTVIERDDDGNPTAIVAPFGQRTALELDANGFLNRIANPAEEADTFTYTDEGLLLESTDPRSEVSTYSYDATGRLQRAEDRAGSAQDIARETTESGFLVSRTTELDLTTTYEVEDLAEEGRLLRVVTPDQVETVGEIGPDGSTVTVSPDGSILMSTSAPDPRFGMQAPIVSNLSLVLPSGKETVVAATRTIDLADANNPLSLNSQTDTVTVDGKTTTYTWDAEAGTVTSVTPAGRSTVSTLDGVGRITGMTNPATAPVSIAYDPQGRVQEFTHGQGAEAGVLTYGYGADGYVNQIIDPIGRIAGYVHDTAGNRIANIRPDNESVLFDWDADGNLVAVTPPGRSPWTFAHGPRGELVAVTPPALPGTAAQTYDYDADGRLTTFTRADGDVISLGYDAGGRVVSRTLLRSNLPVATYTLAYDAAGRVASEGAPNGLTLSYTYDGPFPLAQEWAGPISGKVSVTYDDSLQTASQSVNDGFTVTLERDDDNLLVAAGDLLIDRDAQTGFTIGSTLGVTETAVTYDPFGRAASYLVTAGATPVYSNVFTRDALGRLVERREMIGDGAEEVYRYGYDTVGRLTGVERNGAVVEAYGYDVNGNRTAATVNGVARVATHDVQDRLLTDGAAAYGYDANGRLAQRTTPGGTTTYAYEALGILAMVQLPDGRTITYLVDSQGHRVGKRIDGILVQGFLYGGSHRVVAELDGTGAVVSRFVYAGGLTPAWMTRDGRRYRLVADEVGSVRLVVDADTGAVAQRLDYDAFGNVILDTNPGFQPFGFAGGLWDRDTGLVRFGFRDYDPEVGRFTTRDPILFAGGSSNLYTYAANDPVNGIDPFGLLVDDWGDWAGGVADQYLESVLSAGTMTLNSGALLGQWAASKVLGALGLDHLSLLEDIGVDTESADFTAGELCYQAAEIVAGAFVGRGIGAEVAAERLAARLERQARLEKSLADAKNFRRIDADSALGDKLRARDAANAAKKEAAKLEQRMAENRVTGHEGEAAPRDYDLYRGAGG